ncbi:MAG: hypothetical protein AAF766_05225 [Cyanobacteria bacterium P01_D01_bin.14]
MATKTVQPKNNRTPSAMPELSTDERVNAEPAAANSASDSEAATSVDETTEQIAPEQIDDVFKELKTLLSTVEKLQKARQEVGDIKPALIRLLDGELIDGEELEPLKSGVSSLSKLVKIYGDYQASLKRAQPARDLLDTVLK